MATNTNTGGVTKDDLKSIGRINGPDLQLKFSGPDFLNFNNDAAINTKNIIKADSSITEVLNILSFLISNGGRNFADMVDTTNSAYDGTAGTKGEIDAASGYYAAASTNGPGVFAAFLLNLETLDVTAPSGVDTKLPVSILKRRGAAGAGNDDPDSFEDMTGKQIAKGSVDDVKALFSDCVKQMINLLTQTRLILGPKGWTDLFQKVKGGSKHSKKTKHRRRKYSSNQH